MVYLVENEEFCAGVTHNIVLISSVRINSVGIAYETILHKWLTANGSYRNKCWDAEL